MRQDSNVTKKYRPLGLKAYLGFGAGSMGTGVFTVAPGLLLLIYMTDTLAIPATLAGIAVFIPKLWDVITDPLMGFVSDNTRTRWGRRRPYLLVGAILMWIAFSALFIAPEFDSPNSAFVYVMIMYIACTTAYTVYVIPYTAMPAEMTDDLHERTTIISFRMSFALVGMLVAGVAAPMLVAVAGGGRGGYAVMSVSVGSFCGLAMLFSFFATRGLPFKQQTQVKRHFREQIAIAFQNRSFLVLLVAFLIQLTAAGTALAAMPYYVKYVLGQGAAVFSTLFLCLFGTAILTMPIWAKLSRRTGKHKAYIIACSIYALAGASLFFTSADSTLALVYLLLCCQGLGFSGLTMLPYSMLTDIIEYDALASGMRREGAFTGIWIATEKAGFALGGLAVGLVFGLFGFIESTGGDVVQPESAILAIRCTISLVVTTAIIISLWVLRAYTIDEKALAWQIQAHAGGESEVPGIETPSPHIL